MQSNDNKNISKRLIELRTFSDYSTKTMADMLGIDESEYLSYESGDEETPINIIYRFARLLGTDAQYILSGTMPTKDKASVVYDGKGVSVKRYEGYSFVSLAPDFVGKQMNPMLVVIDPMDNPELVVHGGQEFNYVLDGDLRVVVGDKEYFLHQGDSIFFNPSQPHAQLAMGGKAAKFLTVINE